MVEKKKFIHKGKNMSLREKFEPEVKIDEEVPPQDVDAVDEVETIIITPKDEICYPVWVYHNRKSGGISSKIVKSKEEFDALEPGWINSLARCKANRDSANIK